MLAAGRKAQRSCARYCYRFDLDCLGIVLYLRPEGLILIEKIRSKPPAFGNQPGPHTGFEASRSGMAGTV